MKNRDLAMTDRLFKNKARKLFRQCLKTFRYNSEGDMLLDEEHKAQINQKEPYWKGREEGRLLNEIYAFLNNKSEF